MAFVSIGEINELNRYPVKSFAGERLETSKIETYGLYGDRCYAFIDESKKGWESFFTARDIPNMLTYKARLIGESSEDEFPEIKVTSPDGRIFKWNEELLDEMQLFTKRKIALMSYKPQNPALMAVDAGSILITTDVTLRKLESVWGKQLDKRRFRANLIVSIDDYACDESKWIGKQLSIGSAELQVESYCQRCSMITLDPDTLEHDTSLLKKVNEELNLNFGVYASVKKTGEIHVGEKVYVWD